MQPESSDSQAQTFRVERHGSFDILQNKVESPGTTHGSTTACPAGPRLAVSLCTWSQAVPPVGRPPGKAGLNGTLRTRSDLERGSVLYLRTKPSQAGTATPGSQRATLLSPENERQPSTKTASSLAYYSKFRGNSKHLALRPHCEHKLWKSFQSPTCVVDGAETGKEKEMFISGWWAISSSSTLCLISVIPATILFVEVNIAS